MSSVQSLGRALELLRLICASHTDVLPGQGARLLDLVAASGLAQPTVHRLLRQMAADGLVVQDTQRRWRLGLFAYELGLVAAQNFPLRDQCAPHLARISAATGDTAFLLVRSGSDSFCLDRQSGSFPIQVLTVQPGKRRPLGVGGGGLALLSFMPDDERATIIDRIEPHLAQYGGLTRKVLQDLVQEARAQGWARITNYAVAGVTSVGIPLRTRNGSVFAAISVSAMTERMQPRLDMVLQTMQQEVAALERGL